VLGLAASLPDPLVGLAPNRSRALGLRLDDRPNVITLAKSPVIPKITKMSPTSGFLFTGWSRTSVVWLSIVMAIVISLGVTDVQVDLKGCSWYLADPREPSERPTGDRLLILRG
jgi:hypothetical protein